MFSTKKHTSSKKSHSFIFFLLAILLGYAQTAYTQTESIYLNWDNTSTNLSKCFQQKKFKVLVQNKTGAPISNATIWPTFPSGVSIVAGTIVDKTDSNSVNLNLLGTPYTSGGITWDGTKFTVANPIPDLAVVEITFDLFANCSAANSASVFNTYLLKSNGVNQLSKTNNVTGVQTYTVPTANYSLLSPVLSIASVSNSALSNLNVGNTYVQDVAIVNGGLGEVKNMAVTIDHNTSSSNSFTNLSVIDESDNVAGTAILQSNGKIVDIVLTNSLLQNRTIRLRYTVTVISCNTTSRNISVTYGCPGNVVCSTSNSVTSLNAISTVAPTVKITTTETPFTSSCGLISATGDVTRQIKTVYENTGTSPVTLNNIKFGFMWYAGSDIFNISGYTENIVASSIMVTENNGNPYAPTNIAVFGRNSYIQNINHCSYNKPTSYIMSWNSGYVLAPGAKLTIDYGLTQCDNSAVVDGTNDGTNLDQGQYYIGSSYYAAGNIGTTASYNNQCGIPTTITKNSGGMYGYHMLYSYVKTTDTPPQVLGTTPFPLEVSMDLTANNFNPYGSVFNIANLGSSQRVYMAEIEVPAGVTYVPGSIILPTSNTAIATGYPTFSGNKLVVKFTSTGNGVSALLRASFTSDGITACGKLPVVYRGIAIWDATCTIPLKASTIKRDSIEFVCSNACPSIGPISTENKRITLGLVDNDNNGFPEASGSLNPNKIYLNYIKMKDIYRSSTKYKLYTTANYIQADHRFTLDAALLSKNPNINLTPEGSPTIIITRAGVDTPLTGTIVRMSTTKNDFIIKWDDAMPVSLGGYQINDEITVTQDYKLNTEVFKNSLNVEAPFIPATFNSTIYIASAPTIADNNWTYTGPLKTSCLSLKSGVRYVTSLRPYFNYNTSSGSSICGNIDYTAQLIYSGTTFDFPFEYRNSAEFDDAKFTIGSGLTFIGTSGVSLNINQSVSVANIDTYRTTVGNVITYDLKGYRNSLTTSSVIKYPKENANSSITILTKAASRCEASGNLSIVPITNARRIYTINPSVEDPISTTTNSPYTGTIPLLNATATTPVSQTPNTGTGSYGFKLTNPNLTQTISNGWFYLKLQGGNISVTNLKIGGIAATPNSNGFYTLSTVPANSFVDVTFDMTLAGNCTSDFVKVYYANECTSALIPTSFSSILCSKQIDFTILPASTSMDAQVKPLNGGVLYAFCSPFTVEFDVTSSSLGTIFDILAKVDLPKGIEYVPNSVKVKYPSSGTFTSIAYNPTISNLGQQLDFNVITPSLGGSSVIAQSQLLGTSNVAQNMVSVQYQVRAVCGSDEGVSIKHTFNANKSCGIALPTVVKQSDPIVFSDVVSFPYSMDFTRTKSDVIKNCTTGSPFHISMKNVGPYSTPSDNEISLVLPSTVQFASYTAAGNVRNGSLLQPYDQDNGDGTHTLSWPITANVAQGDSIVMDVMLKPVEGLSLYPTLGGYLFVGKNILLSCDGVICDVFKMNGFKFIPVSSEGGPTAPSVTLTQPTCTTSTGGYTVTSPSGTGYTYSLDSGTYSSSNTVSNLNPGNYTVHVQNANQCFNQTSITIQPQPDLAVVPTLTTTQPTCTTNTGTVTVNTPLASAGYVFSIDGGAYSSTNHFTVAANSAAHTVSAKRTTSVCSETANSAVIISQPITLPAPGAITGINSVLPGTNQSYSISPVTSAASYLWTMPVSWTASSALDGTSASATIGSNGGIVKVASISADGCISPTSNLTVTTGCRAGEVAPNFANTVQNINCGTTFDLSTLVGTNLPSNCSNCVLTFHSDSVATNLNKLSGTAITAANVGTYRAAWYDPSNDCYSNLTAKIQVKNVYPAKPTFTKTNPTCSVATGNLEITNPVGAAYSYSLNGGAFQSSSTFGSLIPGTYTITVKNNYLCTTDSLGIVISPQPLTPTEPIALPVQIYTGTKTVAALSATGTSVQWYANATGGTALASSTNLVDKTTYYASQTASNGCESPRFAVTVNRISEDSQTLCSNSTVANLVTTPTNGNLARWFSDNISTTALSSTTLLASGIYYVEEQTVSNLAISNRVPVNVIIDTVPKATVIVQQPVCGTPTGKITINSPLGTEFTYSINGGAYQTSTVFDVLTASSTYSIRVKSSTHNCESDTTQVTLSAALLVPAKPTISYSRPLTFCNGDSTVLVSNSLAGNQWFKDGIAIPGATNDSLIVHLAGQYKTQITSVDACQSLFSDSLDVVVNTVQTVSITANRSTANLVTVCRVNAYGTFGEATFDAEVKIGSIVQDPNNYNFEWTRNSAAISGATSPNLVLGLLGTYRIKATDKLTSCIAMSDTIRLVHFATPDLSITSSQVSEFNYVCAGKPVVLHAVSTTPGLQYRWKDYFYGSTGTSPFVSSVGVIGSADSLVHNQAYLHNTVLNLGDAPFITAANAGHTFGFAQYYLEVKDTNGCIDNSRVFRFYETLPLSKPTISGDTLGTYCVDKTVTLVSSKLAGNQWYKDDVLIAGATNDSLIVSASGAYKVKYTNDLGCESDLSLARNVNIIPLPAKPVISGNTNASYCEGSSVIISSNSSTGNQWYKNGSIIAGATNVDYTVTDSGIYSLKVTNSNACVSPKSDSISITIKPLPLAIIEQGLELAFTNCTNSPINLKAKDQVITGTSSYEWYFKSTFAGTETLLATTSQTHSATLAGYYRVKVTTDGCSEISTLTRIYDPPVLNTTSTAVCSGDTVTINAVNSGIPNPIYKWFKNNVEMVGQTNAIIKAFVSGTYYVQVSSSSSSVSANSCPVLITVNPLPNISISGNPSNLKACSGSSVILTALASGSTNYAYRWIKDGNILVDTAANYSASINGNYQVQVTDNNGCVNTSAISAVEILALPSPPSVSVLSQTTCTQSTGSIKVNSPLGAAHTYNVDGGTFQTSHIFTNMNVGIHTVRVKNADGCISLPSNDVEILSNAGAPALPLASVSTQPNCIISTGVITVSSPIGPGYTYSIDSTNYQTGLTFSNVLAGSYKVRVKNSDGCISEGGTSLQVIANAGIPSAPTGTVTIQPTCTLSTGTIVVSAPLGTGYLYSIDTLNYQSSPTFTNVAVGNYHIRVKNSDGCIAEDFTSLQVIANAGLPIAPSASVSIQPTCTLATGTIVVSAPTGTGFTYSIDSTNYQASPTFTGVVAGAYKVRVKNADGCISAATNSISVVSNAGLPVAPTASVSIQPTCNLATGTIVVTAPTGAGFTYSIDSTNYQSGLIFTSVAVGSYKVRAKNSDGCVSLPSANLIINGISAIPAKPVATNYSIVNNCNNGGSVDLTTLQPSPSAGITYEWWTGTDSTKVNFIANPSNYSTSSRVYLWAKNVSGCYSTKADPVNVSIVSCCTDSTGSIVPKFQFMLGQIYEPGTINQYIHTGRIASDSVSYVLVNTVDDKIKAINHSLPEFDQVISGDYRIYAINHRPEANVSGIVLGNKLTDIQPYCSNWPFIEVGVVASCDYYTTYSMTNEVPTSGSQTKKFVLIEIGGNKNILEISSTNSFVRRNLGVYQIVELLYTGTATNLAVGNSIFDVTATNLDKTASRYFLNCSSVYAEFQGYIFNDLNKNGIEESSTENQIYLSNHTIFVKILNSSNQVMSVWPVSSGYFNFGQNFDDGTYRFIYDNNDDLTDTIPNYPANWSGAPKYFTVDFGEVVSPNFTNSSGQLVPFGLNSTLEAPSSGRDGNNIQYCEGATANALQAIGVGGSTLNWYTVATGGMSTSVAPVPLTNTPGVTHYYVSQSIDGVESPRLHITVTVAGTVNMPGVITGPNSLGVGIQGTYRVSPVSGATSYIWQLPTGFTGTSNLDSIRVVAGNTGGLIKVATVSASGCQSGFQTLSISVSQDFDGDGVSNDQETLDHTDPNNGCDYITSHVTLPRSAAWKLIDCDGDGNPNETDPEPLNFCIGGINNVIPAEGTPQYEFFKESDCDNDGISNSIECFGAIRTCQDFDGDGIPNFLDQDSDADGISDRTEQNRDSDGDRDANYLDLDSDNDGILDSRETVSDQDKDGTPNYLDLDSDGDNILDAWEALALYRPHTDENLDGKVDRKGIFVDDNNNGLADILERSMGGVPTEVPDTDKDGLADFLDLDSDNDCLPDIIELTNDVDGDNIPNYRDTDSDNDCIPDVIEIGNCSNPIDTDKDGVPNYLDLDSDNDCISDDKEAGTDCNNPVDTDADGIPDYRDTDSDNDCIGDNKEIGGDCNNPVDTDGDGIPDFKDTDSDNDCISDNKEVGPDCNNPVDTDGDGIPDYKDSDSDNDCIKDSIEVGTDCNKPVDTDGDGIPDYKDTDSDNDCISDHKEVGSDCNKPVDTDGDGIPDFKDMDSDNDCIKDSMEVGADCNNPVDTDGDGIPDFKDTDSDNDCISDNKEVGSDCNKPVDTDGDGIPDYKDMDSDNDCINDHKEVGLDCDKPVDTDGDGIPDYRDTDSDNDCISDHLEAGADCNNPVDTDGDGIPDYRDTDSDNDCINDHTEAGADCSKPIDTDGDGIPDYKDTDSDNDCISDHKEAGADCSKPLDTDADGIADYRDADSDNDCISDHKEAGADCNNPVDTDGDGIPDYKDTDSDNDCIKDSLEVGPDCNNPLDTDGDGLPDYKDTDSDNDCIKDALEVGANCAKPVDTDGDGLPDYRDTDSDNDCMSDHVEVGPDCSIPMDTDKDGLPNYQDTDSDNDCISDLIEADGNCLNPVDTDKDDLADYLDSDSDGDCIPDAVEVGPKCNKPLDTDGDGIYNFRDTDSDNDCIPDAKEAGKDCAKPVDTDSDGTQDYLDLDADNDTYSDNIEAGTDCKNPVDTDKDGQPDFQDLDSDGDGIPDKLEDDVDYGNLIDCDKDGIPNRIDPDQCNVFLPKGISPNGDGKNDRLIIPGILSNHKNKLTILNRWGNVVYESENYQNNWTGQTTRAFDLLSTDGLLPDGTYYYVIDFMGTRPNIGAYVYINRLEK